jgi:phospholipase/carboxylesterase
MPTMNDALVIQMPDGPAQQLMLLFHGVGATPEHMEPLARHLAQAFPQAAVVSVPGPDEFDLGQGAGRQWFSVRAIDENNRAARVAEAMPGFVETVKQWRERTGASLPATALIGFSQGAIMALESTQLGEALAGRVVALAGRFANLPALAPEATTVHLIHGKADTTIPYVHTIAAAERLIELGGDVTADVIPFLDHRVTDEVAELLVERLKGYLPQRVWREAMREAPDS